MWDLPGPGHEPVSLALAGGFLTTAGKSLHFVFKDWILQKVSSKPSLKNMICKNLELISIFLDEIKWSLV